MNILLVIGGFVALTFLSRYTTKNIMNFFYLMTGSKKITLILIHFIFLPGVIIHELSHLIIANLLLVHTGKIRIFPDLNSKNQQISLGSVEVAKSDFLRSVIIGLAPTITGSLLLALIYSLIDPLSWFITGTHNINIIHITGIYLLFVISNTLHTSPSDRRYLPHLIIFLGAIFIIYRLLQLNLSFPVDLAVNFDYLLANLSQSFLMAIILSSLILVLFKLLNSLMSVLHTAF
jgi:branched-subunit amino acid transport protein